MLRLDKFLEMVDRTYHSLLLWAPKSCSQEAKLPEAAVQSVPEPQALAVVRRLRSTSNMSAVLASIKGNLSTVNKPSDLSQSRHSLPPMESEIEFEPTALHQTVYPKLLPVDVASIDIDRLATSAPRRSYQIENLDSKVADDQLGNDDPAPSPLRVVNVDETFIFRSYLDPITISRGRQLK